MNSGMRTKAMGHFLGRRRPVILPIKGVDQDTENNVRALLAQRYLGGYRLLFAVESADDPVVALLERVRRETSGTATHMEVVVAGLAATRGQKIHNQLAAVARTTAEDAVLVFMDADARPADGWLRDLVRPLAGTQRAESGATAERTAEIGATTGFRFYVPANRRLPNIMVSVINAAVAALLGPGWRNMAWGGSMAIRREDFFGFGVEQAWQRALSDDYVLSWCVKNQAKRRIQFVQGCLVGSVADFSWGELWEFAVRQYRITRVCAPGVWLAALGGAKLYLIGMLYTFVFFWLSVAGLVPADSLTGRVDYPLGVMFVALYVANVIRGWFLLEGGKAALPEQAGKLRDAWFWFTFGYPVSLLVNLAALLKSARGRGIEWRNVRYTLHNRLETTVERPKA